MSDAEPQLPAVQEPQELDVNEPDEGLSQQHADFAHWFVIYGNRAKAAIKAGYSVDTARQAGHQLMLRPDVLREVARLRRQSEQRKTLTRQRIEEELAIQVNADPRELANVESMSDIADLPEHVGKTIRKIRRTSTYNKETHELRTDLTIEGFDKVAALGLAAKVKGMGKDVDAPTQVIVNIGLPKHANDG